MRTSQWTAAMALGFALAITQTGLAQGNAKAKGNGPGRGNSAQKAHGGGPDKAMTPARGKQEARGQARAAQKHDARTNARDDDRLKGRANAAARQMKNPGIGQQVSGGDVVKVKKGRSLFVRRLVFADVRPTMQRYVVSTRPAESLAGSAIAYALARGLSDDELVLVPVGNTFTVRNKHGVRLLELDDNRARDIGSWPVVAVKDEEKSGSPAFCRSGAGHPVWGRQWCIDKGFGLGTDDNVVWGRTTRPVDLVLRPASTSGSLTTDVLRTVLGNVVFDRLALHAVTLGYADPLTGKWLGETATGPRVLLLSSGTQPVAEFVDTNRDGRADNMLVVLRPW